MAEPTITKDKFIIDHVDFGLREQANYPNGGTSKFYDNGTDMVIIDEDICDCNAIQQNTILCNEISSKRIRYQKKGRLS